MNMKRNSKYYYTIYNLKCYNIINLKFKIVKYCYLGNPK